jgi:hypothetical protein
LFLVVVFRLSWLIYGDCLWNVDRVRPAHLLSTLLTEKLQQRAFLHITIKTRPNPQDNSSAQRNTSTAKTRTNKI